MSKLRYVYYHKCIYLVNISLGCLVGSQWEYATKERSRHGTYMMLEAMTVNAGAVCGTSRPSALRVRLPEFKIGGSLTWKNEWGGKEGMRNASEEELVSRSFHLRAACQWSSRWTRRFWEADTKWLEGRQLGELFSNMPTLGFHQSN